MLRKAITKLIEGKNLSEAEIVEALSCIMEGKATQAQIGSFITALRIKGETTEEITGCARVMREKAERISPNVNTISIPVAQAGMAQTPSIFLLQWPLLQPQGM